MHQVKFINFNLLLNPFTVMLEEVASRFYLFLGFKDFNRFIKVPKGDKILQG
jgi:hypothetical protein